MRKIIAGIAVGAGVAAFTLLAADAVWTKPFADWTDMDVKKILTDSPWADQMDVDTGQRGVIATDQAKGNIQGNLTTSVTVYWQSALPIKQAMLGRANATDAQKQLLAREEASHLLRVEGLPGSARAATQDLDKLKAATTIRIKGKPDLHPSEIQVSAPTSSSREPSRCQRRPASWRWRIRRRIWGRELRCGLCIPEGCCNLRRRQGYGVCHQNWRYEYPQEIQAEGYGLQRQARILN